MDVAVECLSECTLPTEFGSQCVLRVYGQPRHASPHASPQWVVCAWGDTHGRESLPMRVHDACLTSEIFGSLKCDCAKQLRLAQRMLASTGGLLVYTPQEGRGIGLAQKVAAYALQETQGLDTVDANIALGEPAECRDYAPVRAILDHLGVRSVVLLTNNPFKVHALSDLGVQVLSTRPVVAAVVPEQCAAYLHAKAKRMGHMLPLSSRQQRQQQQRQHYQEEEEHEPPCEVCVDEDEATPPPPFAEALLRLRRQMADHQSRHHQHALLIQQPPQPPQQPQPQRASSRGSAAVPPFVTLTYAQALDGSIAGPHGAHGPRLMLSGSESMAFTHALRAAHDAILVGVGTLLADNPQLNVRLVAGSNPMRVVLDSHLRSPPHAKALKRPTAAAASGAAAAAPHAVVVTLARTLRDDPRAAGRAALLRREGVHVIGVAADEEGHVLLAAALEQLGARFGTRSVMIEGGASVIGACAHARAAHRVIITLAPKMLVNGLRPGATTSTSTSSTSASSASVAVSAPSTLDDVHTFSLGEDVIVSGVGPAASVTAAAKATSSKRDGNNNNREQPQQVQAQQTAVREPRLLSRL